MKLEVLSNYGWVGAMLQDANAGADTGNEHTASLTMSGSILFCLLRELCLFICDQVSVTVFIPINAALQ